MKRLMCSAAALLLLAVLSNPALAGVGLHAGLSIDPDDFLVGLHFDSHAIDEQVRIVPSVEAGFGDVTMIAGNLDLHYVFETDSKLAPYAGGGITLNWFDFDRGSSTDFGGAILGGIRISPKLFFEAKIGLGDVPDWKLVVGIQRP